ncbi:receptor-like protein 14 [Quercus suber]|uniref:receptor-like protein 14 n=1 Tax=Quercus suber TaxID=58331 RepID=UPI0032E01263
MFEELNYSNIAIYLHCSKCSYINEILFLNISLLETFKELGSLDLSRNAISGWLENEGFKSLLRLNKLERLDLDFSMFNWSIMQSLRLLTSLKTLNLSYNELEGSFPTKGLCGLKKLEGLDLANHSSLEFVRCICNDKDVKIEMESSDWVPLFQLDFHVISNCNLNKLSNKIPTFLLHQHNFRVMFICRGLNTYWMDMSNNRLIGKLQGNIEEVLPNIFHLKLSNNSFTGSLPSSIGNMSLLGTFDVSLNDFSRQVPKELLAGCLRLSSLVLSNNNFSGHSDWLSLFNLTELFLLKINHNQFAGAMSNELPNWVFLALLDVSNNMSELLLTLDVSDNRLSGSIPSAIANAASSLRILSLRGYCLSGTFPTQLSFSTQTGGSDNGQSEEYVEQDEVNIVTKYRNSSYTGNILNYMSGLDLSCNNLTGAIPLELGQLQEIHALNLSHNQLTGSIPKSLSK